MVAHTDERMMSRRPDNRDWAPPQELAAEVTTPVRLDSEFQHHNIPPRTLVYVGGAKGPRRDMLDWGDLEPAGWINRFSFGVFRENLPGTIQINIGQASGPHRVMIAMGRRVNVDGWTNKINFYAWERRQPGTVMVAVGEAYSPHRCKFVIGRHIGDFPGEDNGWAEKCVFWAYYY